MVYRKTKFKGYTAINLLNLRYYLFGTVVVCTLRRYYEK